ncbi:MAG: hypothetical protein GQ470_06725 [Gammaproteobacteria bacterium]|nr:hypothetical protein [Gammaproteobacteria bacterium]
MSSCCTPPDGDKSLDTLYPNCPSCDQPGQLVNEITPRHTLKGSLRKTLSTTTDYHFCENPTCDTVYFNRDGEQIFTTEQLINRVTCKDPSPETPLCYCFKITKGDALYEYQDSHQSSVLEVIEEKMGERSCFCDKSNPRGICCTTEIKVWLKAKGIEGNESPSTDSCCGSSCS